MASLFLLFSFECYIAKPLGKALITQSCSWEWLIACAVAEKSGKVFCVLAFLRNLRRSKLRSQSRVVIAPNGPCGATDGKKTLLGGVGVALMFTRHGIFITALDALEDTSRGGGGGGGTRPFPTSRRSVLIVPLVLGTALLCSAELLWWTRVVSEKT